MPAKVPSNVLLVGKNILSLPYLEPIIEAKESPTPRIINPM